MVISMQIVPTNIDKSSEGKQEKSRGDISLTPNQMEHPVSSNGSGSKESSHISSGSHHLSTSGSVGEEQQSNNVQSGHTNGQSAAYSEGSLMTNEAQLKRARYIDELGFYRHVDSSGNAIGGIQWTSLTGPSPKATNRASAQRELSPTVGDAQPTNSRRLTEGSYEGYFNEIRSDLRISHFDRISGYDEWKHGWDQFIKAKMSEPAVLNQRLKERVRTGIPHDYRAKVWSAVIWMRTKSLRASVGDDVYQVISKELASTKLARYQSQKQQEGEGKSSGDVEGSFNKQTNNRSTENDRRATRDAGSSWFPWTRRRQPSDPPGQINEQKGHRWQQMEACFKQIELDLLRTLPNNCHFETSHSRGVERVRKVLRAYAMFNPTVGYCQGMNRLAAMALLVLPEREAFWCLVTIVQCIMPKDYYLKPWLAQVDCCVMNDLMAKRMPRLHKHLSDNDIQLTLFSWFFTIFVDGFRPELLLRIWDCFLLEGDEVLFRFALAILLISHEDLLTMSDFSTMSNYLNRLVSGKYLDVDYLFEAFESIDFISSNDIKSRREYHRKRLQLLFDD